MMTIAGVPIGDGRCKVVAEISNNHNGDYDRCLRLIRAARYVGADLIKFQCYSPAELLDLRGAGPAPEPWGSQGWSMADLYAKAQTPFNWFPRLATYCAEQGIPWFSSVFGSGSLALLEALDCPAYKLASLDFGKRALNRMVRSTGKPVIQSCAHDTAPKTCDVALWCPPGYPQAPQGFNGRFRGYGGFSYHGTDPLVPLLAAAHGARVVECHVQLDDEPSELEAGVSLTIRQLGWLVSAIGTVDAWS
jgi:N-acetylneuraminate synthase